MRFPRMTTRRWMLAIFVVGGVIGGAIEIDRARQRRSDYLGMASEAAEAAGRAHANAVGYTAQAKAMREWVTEGSKGPPPGLGDFSGQTHAVFTFGRDTAKALSKDPEKALAFARYFDCESENNHGLQVIRTQWKEWAERNASFPRMFFARDPKVSELTSREWYDRGVSLVQMRTPM